MVDITIVSSSQLEKFIKSYLQTFEELASKFRRSDRVLILPRYLTDPYKNKVKAAISETHGVTIEFFAERIKEDMQIEVKTERVEDIVFPKLSENGNVFFTVEGPNTILENVNLITQEFYEKHKELIEKLSRATNIVMDNPKTFIEVREGDIKLIDVTLAYSFEDMEYIKKIDCLWIFATNSSDFFSPEKAKELARIDYEKIISGIMGKVPIRSLIAVLHGYKELLDRYEIEGLKEEEIQKFLETNYILLEPSAKLVYTRGKLRKIFGKFEPDFAVYTANSEYIIIELEKPSDKLFRKKRRRLIKSPELEEAESQIRDYLSELKTNITDYQRRGFPYISADNVRGLILIGRSSKMGEEEIEEFKKIRARAKDYEIITFDELFERVKTFLENLGIRFSPFG